MRWRPLLLLGAPTLLVIGAIGFTRIQSNAAREGLEDVSALGWTRADLPIEVRSTRVAEGELEAFTFEFLSAGTVIHHTEFTIDHDLFGGGFVGGLDVDADGALELVLATRSGRARSRLIEPGREGIVERAFTDAPDHTWVDVERRLETVAPGGSALVAAAVGFTWLVLGSTIYALMLLWRAIRRIRCSDRPAR